MQLGKNIKIFTNYFLGPLLFIWLSFSMYRQITQQSQLAASWWHIRQSFHSTKIGYLLFAVMLIPFNWGVEAYKWKLCLQSVYRISLVQAFMAVLSGIAFSVTMPNRIGEYVGRLMYLPEGNRLKTIAVTMVGSFAQLLVTLLAGTAGLMILKKNLLEHFNGFTLVAQFLQYGLLLLCLFLIFLYFNVTGGVRVFSKWIRNQKYVYLVTALNSFTTPLLLRLLLLSFVRYIIFMLQYLFVFYLFDVNVGVFIMLDVMSVVFLAMAVIPSIALVEVWLRGEIIILLMGLFSANTLGIGFTSVTIWCLNLILPAIAGSLLLLKLRVFNKRHETV